MNIDLYVNALIIMPDDISSNTTPELERKINLMNQAHLEILQNIENSYDFSDEWNEEYSCKKDGVTDFHGYAATWMFGLIFRKDK